MRDSSAAQAARERLCAVTAAAAVLAGTSLALFAETPARAQDTGFAASFAPYAAPADEAPPVAAAPAPEGRSIGSGKASFYSTAFAGRPTASGERFNPSALTAAHRTLPFGTRVLVTNTGNGRSVVVRINDRGPFHGNRVIDLSPEAARQIGIIAAGSGQVRLASFTS